MQVKAQLRNQIHPALTNAGFETPFYRFQNYEISGAYIYATGAEADRIRTSCTNFNDEGIAVEAAI